MGTILGELGKGKEYDQNIETILNKNKLIKHTHQSYMLFKGILIYQ